MRFFTGKRVYDQKRDRLSHPNGWGKIEMHILKYYVKRCIGLPGDTLSICSGRFRIGGVDTLFGNPDSQERIGQRLAGEFPDGIYKSFPFDSTLNWNIRDFGPLYIPKAGDKVEMNRKNIIVGKATFFWKSVDPYTCKFRWERFLKKIE